MSLVRHSKQDLGASKLISILSIQQIYYHQLRPREMSDVGNATT
jgi:hypothetical protein